ncbi:MAG: hypothetical protein ACYCTW_12265, partial [Sulfuricella sp.]
MAVPGLRIEESGMKTLHKFHGGVHPPEHKTESSRLPIAVAPLPQRLIVPLRQ